MRGWVALTSNWARPVLPEKVLGRTRLLSREQRKKVYEMDLLVRETQADIAAVFERAGINREQMRHQLRSIRKNRG